MQNLKQELADLESQIKTLQDRKRDIYKRSLAAPEEDKVCPDFAARMLAGSPPPSMPYPIEVRGIAWGEESWHLSRKPAKWVAVRPCGPEAKTYLGLYVGDIALVASARFDCESGVLSLSPGMHNPAIYVPDLGRLVFGCQSWWSEIEKPEDLQQITDAKIDDVWYVRALRGLSD